MSGAFTDAENRRPAGDPIRRGDIRLPDRIILLEEAQARKLVRYYTGEPCNVGHIAERFTANPAMCCQCDRERPRTTKGKKRPHPNKGAGFPIVTGHPERGRAVAMAYKLEEESSPVHLRDRMNLKLSEIQKILELYTDMHDLAGVAKAVGISRGALEARAAMSRPLYDGFSAIERRLNLTVKTPPPDTDLFQWDADSRAALIETFIDTGDIAAARDRIHVSPSRYNRELRDNPEFAKAIEEAHPLAMQHLEERAIQMALHGNDRVLQLALKANNAKYKDAPVKIDINQTTLLKLDDSALDARLAALLAKRQEAIDVEFSEEERAQLGHDGGDEPGSYEPAGEDRAA